MGFFSNLVSSTVKTALTPVAIVVDGVKVVTGDNPNTTKKLLQDAVEDAKDAADDLADGDL